MTPEEQQKMMQAFFLQMNAQQQDGRLQSQREAIGSGDVVGEANKRAATVGSAWASGGAFADQPQLSPEAKLASQGNSAMNQWAQLGGVPDVNVGTLQALNENNQPEPQNNQMDFANQKFKQSGQTALNPQQYQDLMATGGLPDWMQKPQARGRLASNYRPQSNLF